MIEWYSWDVLVNHCWAPAHDDVCTKLAWISCPQIWAINWRLLWALNNQWMTLTHLFGMNWSFWYELIRGLSWALPFLDRCSFRLNVNRNVLMVYYYCQDMAVRDANLRAVYKAQTSNTAKHAPLIQRGEFLHKQVSESTFPEKRKAGHMHVYGPLVRCIHLSSRSADREISMNFMFELAFRICRRWRGWSVWLRQKSRVARRSKSWNIVGISWNLHLLKERVLNLQRHINEQQ